MQSEIELIFEDETQLLQDMNEAAKFREKAISVRIAATERLDALSKLSENKYTGSDNASVVSACSGPGSTRNNDVRLPKLVLPKFSGDILEFETFWDQLQANIDDSDLPDISKFSYLRNLLEGDAAQTIQGLTLNAQNYKAVSCFLIFLFILYECPYLYWLYGQYGGSMSWTLNTNLELCQ